MPGGEELNLFVVEAGLVVFGVRRERRDLVVFKRLELPALAPSVQGLCEIQNRLGK